MRPDKHCFRQDTKRGALTMRILQIAVTALMATSLMAGAAFAGTVAQPAPEPASMALLAVGIGGIAVLRKVRRRK